MPVSDSEAIKFISQNQMDPIVVVKGDGEGGGGGGGCCCNCFILHYFWNTQILFIIENLFLWLM